MTEASIFLWGAGGSLAVPIVQAALNYNGTLPELYERVTFYAIQLLLAAVAGGLALAHSASTALLAIHIGAATPLIVQGFSRQPPTA
jgi:hypothetical protein